MNDAKPRLRMFAGPNGSGKSTLKDKVAKQLGGGLLGVIVDPDRIEREIREQGGIDLNRFSLSASAADALVYLLNHPLIVEQGLRPATSQIKIDGSRLNFTQTPVNSYFASALAGFIHQRLIAQGTSFSMETVMSHGDKRLLLWRAFDAGFRNYLYYVATDDPAINIARVKNRVAEGGHDVEERKIVSRYERSLDKLIRNIRLTHRAYIFDNSGPEMVWLAEVTNGRELQLKSSTVPHWFQRYVLDRRNAQEARVAAAREVLLMLKDAALEAYHTDNSRTVNLQALPALTPDRIGPSFGLEDFSVTSTSPKDWEVQCANIFDVAPTSLILRADLTSGKFKFNQMVE